MAQWGSGQSSQTFIDVAQRELEVILRAEQRPEITSHFPFQRLPPEIRNAIYHLHLVQAEDLTQLRKWDDSVVARAHGEAVIRSFKPNYIPPPFEYTALSILAASRQLHHEALGIFYYHNSFRLEDVGRLRDFLSSIGPERRGFIRNIRFRYEGIGSAAASKLLATCENLTKLHIKVSDETLKYSRGISMLEARGVGYLLKIRGLKTVEISQRTSWPDEQMGEFEETVRDALLQPRATKKSAQLVPDPKRASKGKKIAAGKKHTIEGGKAPRAKKTKLVYDGTQIVNQREDSDRDT